MEHKDKYWFCIIGPVKDNELPDGADSPLRSAVRKVANTMLPDNDLTISSGWGVSDTVRDLISAITVRSLSDNEAKQVIEFVRKLKVL